MKIPVTDTNTTTDTTDSAPSMKETLRKIIRLERLVMELRTHQVAPLVYLRLRHFETGAGVRGLAKHLSWWVACFHDIRSWYFSGKLTKEQTDTTMFRFSDWSIEEVILSGTYSPTNGTSKYESVFIEIDYRNPWVQGRVRDALCFMCNMVTHRSCMSTTQLIVSAKNEWERQCAKMEASTHRLNLRAWPSLTVNSFMSPISFAQDGAYKTATTAVKPTIVTKPATIAREYKKRAKICFFSREKQYDGKKYDRRDDSLLQDWADDYKEGWWGAYC